MITSVEGGKLIKIKWVWGRRHNMGGGDERFSLKKKKKGVSNVIHLELPWKLVISLRDVKYRSNSVH
jgi:hypothetical protein